MNTQVADILELSVAEKIQIVEDIWDSITSNPDDLPLSEAEKLRLDERLHGYQQAPNEGSSWKSLKKNLLQTK